MMLDEKKRARKELKDRIFSIPSELRQLASFSANSFLRDIFQKSSFKVLSFASKPFEISLWPLNEWLAKEKRLLLPKIENNLLKTYQVDDLKQLRLSSYGIQEPYLCIPNEDPGFILVPGLGFNDSFHRIGYGKGHYDQFLKRFSKIPKYGIAFKEQKYLEIPIEKHDIFLDEVHFF